METIDNNLLKASLYYRSKGWPIIPVNPTTKKPILNSWKIYQEKLPTEEEIIEWWTTWPWANIGVITGKLAGITVVDIDPRHGGSIDGLPETVRARTGGGGWHYLYKYSDECHSQNGIEKGLDLKSDGGYIIIAPSTHASGNQYKWITLPFSNNFSELPERFHNSYRNSEIDPVNFNEIFETKEGKRDENLYRAACSLLARGVPSRLTYQFLLFLNTSFKPDPLPIKDVETKFKSAVSWLLKERSKDG